jgi:DNA-binding transcriptional MocR family regulator
VQPGLGPDLALLEEAGREHEIKALLFSGCCHSPLGNSLADSKKKQVVALCERLGVPIIEFDCFGDLAFSRQRPKPLKAFDSSGNVLYCGACSHLVAPNFPYGWLLAGRFQAEVETITAIGANRTARLTQLAHAEFLESGAYERHLRKLTRVLAQSSRALAAAVAEHFPAGTRVTSPGGGFCLWVQLPRKLIGMELYRAALDEGISILPGILFSPNQQFEDCVRLTCGWEWSDRAARAVATLGSLAGRLAS